MYSYLVTRLWPYSISLLTLGFLKCENKIVFNQDVLLNNRYGVVVKIS